MWGSLVQDEKVTGLQGHRRVDGLEGGVPDESRPGLRIVTVPPRRRLYSNLPHCNGGEVNSMSFCTGCLESGGSGPWVSD